MSRKENLIKSLNIAIRALENDTVDYNWNVQEQCNCGVVSQAILGLHVDEFHQKVKSNNLFSHKMFDKKDVGGEQRPKTWKNAVKAWCPIANKPFKTIFTELTDAGLSPDDICHLEYMENKAILDKAGISTVITYNKDVQVGTNYAPSTSFLGKLFGKKIAVPVYETKTFTAPDKDFYKKKENLIKYLKGWVKILKEERDPIEEDLSNYHINELNERLLVAVADEDYTTAINLRNTISEYIH